MGHVARRALIGWEHPRDGKGFFIPLHDDTDIMLSHLRSAMFVSNFKVVCDDSVNTPISLDSLYPSIMLDDELTDAPDSWMVMLGPDANRAMDIEQVYDL